MLKLLSGIERSDFGAIACVFLLLMLLTAAPLAAQDEPSAIDEELAQQQAVAERFLTVLEKNPRRGTALDRVYGFHVESGTLDALIQRNRERTQKDASDGTAWMILGLIEAERGQDGAAAEAFRGAAAALPQNALAPYYLGQSLILTGDPDGAIKAFEEAIARKPPRPDLLDIYQALGRLHQRAQRDDAALEVWKRLEQQFPDDPRVLEQIAVTLVEEGEPALALPRYETLIQKTRDDYRKSVYRMEAAELKLTLKRSAEAIADLEGLLQSLNPSSWLHREVRRRIEEVYLRTADYDGLVKYYEGWIEKHPDDVDAMARLARLLARQARVPEAQAWLDKALKLAPSRKELRLAFIEQLVEQQRYGEAIAQYEELNKVDPDNPDYLRAWGHLILRDTTLEKPERQRRAAQVWRRLVAARPNDPLAATQVADQLRLAEMPDEALPLYQRAVELAPDQPQYREYLGEFYHQLQRPDDALATWRAIAAGERRSAATLARLAEVLASFGYLNEAIPEIQAACRLDPKDFALQMKGAELLARAEKHDDALAQLAAAQALVQNAEESEAVLAARLKIYEGSNTLVERTEALAAEIGQRPTADKLYELARYREALRDWPGATEAIEAALKQNAQAIPYLATAARLYEASGALERASGLFRRLATVDRRGRGEYLQHVARLETQLGRIDRALEAGRDLIASAPGNTEHYAFFADLCFRLGKADDGIAALRRAMRVNPSDVVMLRKLAESLAGQFRTAEAIELYWQALDKETELDGKLDLVSKLAELYLQVQQFDRLLDRFERQRRDADDPREATLCLAQAYFAVSDYGMARHELETLLTEETRDTQLLQQLSKLAESSGEVQDAVKYQERLARIAPGPETEYRLAMLLASSGATEESTAIIVRLALREESPERLLRSIDMLLPTNPQAAADIAQAKLRDDPQNWELLYRAGESLADKPQQAIPYFEAILALSLPDETPGVAEKSRRAAAARSAQRQALSTRTEDVYRSYEAINRVREELSLNADAYRGSLSRRWSYRNYGEARLATLGWLLRMANDRGERDSFLERYRSRASEAQAPARALWDWYAVQRLDGDDTTPEGEGNFPPFLLTLQELGRRGDVAARFLFLTQLRSRSSWLRQREPNRPLPPLSDEELNFVLECFQEVQRVVEPHIAVNLANTVLAELRRSGREEQANRLHAELRQMAQDSGSLRSLTDVAAAAGNTEEVLELFQRWSKSALADRSSLSNIYLPSSVAALIQREKSPVTDQQTLALLDLCLDLNREASLHLLAHPTGRRRTVVSLPFSLDVGESPYFLYNLHRFYRVVFNRFQKNDVATDLLQHLEARLAAAPEANKFYEHLALAYFYEWSAERELASEQLLAAGQRTSDPAFHLTVARLHLLQNSLDEARACLDQVHPQDPSVLQERELLALELAVRLGDVERARQAAERLFGLRLDAPTQLKLAEQMRQLGLHEQADAVLARVERQAGSRTDTLVTLMQSHQTRGNTDQAVQIAHQILRRARPTTIPQRGMQRLDFRRQSALNVLQQVGKLRDMIADLERQVERSPQAVQLYESLAEYYQAINEQDQALAWRAKLVELRPNDALLRYRYAEQLVSARKREEACRQIAAAIETQPSLLRDNFYTIRNVFQAAEQTAELAKLLDKIDFRQIGQTYDVIQLVTEQLRDETQRPQGLAMLKRLWQAYPTERDEILRYLLDDKVWELPEIYDYGREVLLPGARPRTAPWQGLGEIQSYRGDGTTMTIASRLLTAAANSNRLPQLREEVAAACEKHPEWKAGPLLLAMVDARTGNFAAPRSAVEKLLREEEYIPRKVCWTLAQELEAHESLHDLALALHERATSQQEHFIDFNYSPAIRLIHLYAKAGQIDKARSLLRKAETGAQSAESTLEPYVLREQQIDNLYGIARLYHEIGLTGDALRVCQEVLKGSGAIYEPEMIFNSYDHYVRLLLQFRKEIIDGIQQRKEAQAVIDLLQSQSVKDDALPLDLYLQSDRAADGSPVLQSHLLQLLTNLPDEARPAVDKALAGLVAAHGNDVQVRVLAACDALERRDTAAAHEHINAILAAVEREPLEPIPAGRRPNARQRQAALQRVPLALVAVRALAQEEFRSAGERLLAAALEGARRQQRPDDAVAILFSAARQALARGDRPSAEEHLTALVDLLRPTRGKSGRVPPVTLPRFQQLLAAAQLAAEHDIPEVALSAARAAIVGGEPVPEPTSDRQLLGNGAYAENASPNEVIARGLFRLSQTWRQRALPANEFCDLLHAVVFPDNRPGVVGLYDLELDDMSSEHRQPALLGYELVRWSIASDKLPRLEEALASRAATASLAVDTMRALVAIETGNHDAARAALEKLKPTAEATGEQRHTPALQTIALAFERPELQEVALPLMIAAVRRNHLPLHSVARYYVERRDNAGLQTICDEWLAGRQPHYGQVFDDLSFYVQQQDLQAIAELTSQSGDPRLTLRYLGQLTDLPATRSNADIRTPLAHLAWQLRSMPPAERYALLRDWTLPTEKRRSVRVLSAVWPGVQLPEAFFPEQAKALGPPPEAGILSTLALLVDAAREAESLDELHTAAQQAVSEKLLHGTVLLALVEIARQSPNAAEAAQSVLDAARQRVKNPPAGSLQEQQLTAGRLLEMVVLQAAHRHEATRAIARQAAPHLLEDNRRGFKLEHVSHLCRLIAQDAIADLPAAEQARLRSPGLRYWAPASGPLTTNGPHPPAWWTAHDKYLTHLAGYEYDSLYFHYPLTGTFELSFEAHGYDFSQGEVAYGGLISVPEYWNDSSQVIPVGRHETLSIGGAVDARDWWNRYAVKVTPEAIRFYANDHLVYETDSSATTSPWLHLVALDHRRTAFRNLRLTGQPQIPREVKLVADGRLDGWRTLLGDTLPNTLTEGELQSSLIDAFGDQHPGESDEPHWSATGDVLRGKFEPLASADARSCISYHRPLRAGERVSYEFLYQPGRTHVHPAIGHLVFLLEPDGIRLHYLTTTDTADAHNPFLFLPDHTIAEPQHRRGPQQLPLKEGEWNTAQFERAGDTIRLSLNGQLVYERPLDPQAVASFGLFHRPGQTAAEVRNIVLTGDWPKAFTEHDQLLALEHDPSPAELLARHALTREEELVDEAYEVVRAAQAMPAEERFEFLRAWVLPSELHPTFRLQTAFTPSNPPAPSIQNELKSLTGRRRHVGGELVSPAWELMKTARELERLDEAERAITSAKVSGPDVERERTALAVLVAAARGDDDEGKAQLAQLLARLKQLDPDTPPWRRHAEVAAVLAALERPALRADALPVAQLLVENQQSNYHTIHWERIVRYLRARAHWMNNPATADRPMGATPPELTQWQPVSHPSAEQRGRGLPAPSWHFERGKVEFFTGQGNDSLLFQSPLTGDFEVRCRRTTYGWKEIRPAYAAVGIDVHYQGISVFRHAGLEPNEEFPIEGMIPNWGEVIDYRLVVKDGAMTVYFNGKQAHTERLPIGFDPWLSIQTHSPHFNGWVENVQILGSPTIPDQVELSAAPTLDAWRFDYGGGAPWRKDGREIVGDRMEWENAPRSRRESVLHYHRPLLEDGELTYEFYYEPGKTEVHPALDRAALLLANDGVRVHYVTDGPYDRSGTLLDNATLLVDSAKTLPLREKEWNHVKLTLAGDVATLSLNDEKVATYTLEATNQRLFGLFRYSGATAARVRNIVYRGDWPKTLPALAGQQLAAPEADTK